MALVWDWSIEGVLTTCDVIAYAITRVFLIFPLLWLTVSVAITLAIVRGAMTGEAYTPDWWRLFLNYVGKVYVGAAYGYFISVLATLVISWMAYRWLEEPMINIGRQFAQSSKNKLVKANFGLTKN